MTLSRFMPWLVLALALSVAVMAFGAARHDAGMTSLAAAGFVSVTLSAALALNWPLWNGTIPAQDDNPRVTAVRRNIRLVMLVYAWGGAALLAVHMLAGLKWFHAPQYGIGATLIAGGLLWYVHRLGEPEHAKEPPPILNILHGTAAAGGLAFLIGSGKIWSQRVDWAANEIFLWGGIAIVSLCIITAITQSSMARNA